ncbi:MAG: hypothetical protein V5789_05100 [Colwellia sp.]
MYEKSALVFWLTLGLYILTLYTVSYVGVYLTYIAIPMIVVSGLIMKLSKPKPKTQQLLDSVSSVTKDVKLVTNDILDEINTATSQYNEKSRIKHQKILNDRLKKIDKLDFD